MYEIPMRCNHCGSETMVDLSNLDSRPLSKVITAEGFICQDCEKWESVFYFSVSLQELIAKLNKAKFGTRRWRMLFAKCQNKSENLQLRIREELRDGKIKYADKIAD